MFFAAVFDDLKLSLGELLLSGCSTDLRSDLLPSLEWNLVKTKKRTSYSTFLYVWRSLGVKAWSSMTRCLFPTNLQGVWLEESPRLFQTATRLYSRIFAKGHCSTSLNRSERRKKRKKGNSWSRSVLSLKTSKTIPKEKECWPPNVTAWLQTRMNKKEEKATNYVRRKHQKSLRSFAIVLYTLCLENWPLPQKLGKSQNPAKKVTILSHHDHAQDTAFSTAQFSKFCYSQSGILIFSAPVRLLWKS